LGDRKDGKQETNFKVTQMKLAAILINGRDQYRKTQGVDEINNGNNPEAAIHLIQVREIRGRENDEI
jgi:hypothetical protein